MSAHIEIQNSITDKSVEQAYRRAKQIQREFNSSPRARSLVSQGMRAAKARDPKMLKTLDKCAEVLYAMQETQMGETQRQNSTARRERGDQVAVSLWREAFKLADRGTPIVQFQYVYAAAAELAGVTV